MKGPNRGNLTFGAIVRIRLIRKNNRVEPAQPDLSKQNGLSRLNPNSMKKKKRVEPAQPDFDKQCVVKASVLPKVQNDDPPTYCRGIFKYSGFCPGARRAPIGLPLRPALFQGNVAALKTSRRTFLGEKNARRRTC